MNDVPDERASGSVQAPSAVDVGRMIEAGFAAAVAREIRRSHAAGIAVPISGGDGTVVWLFPDGTRRKTVEDGDTTLGVKSLAEVSPPA